MTHDTHGHLIRDHPTRREICRQAIVGSLVCSLAGNWQRLLGAESQNESRYDLLIKGGRVVDPSQQLSAVKDIGISGRRVARVAENLSASDARQVLDARGKIVTPGLIDVHVHVYDGVTPLGLPADPNCIALSLSPPAPVCGAQCASVLAHRRTRQARFTVLPPFRSRSPAGSPRPLN